MNLTTKELAAIEDLLNGEANTVKKFSMYAQNAPDTQTRAKYEQLAAKHQEHFNKLLSFLN